MPRGRYAPSPSGWQHLGNARTALVAWARARQDGSSFLLRVEDLDGPRTVEEAVLGNLEELRWLGLDWDEGPDVGGRFAPYRQSLRVDRYGEALANLEAQGGTFACYLSRKELRDVASAPHGATPAYGPRERAENARIAGQREREGRVPAVRLALRDEVVAWRDGIAGEQRVEVARVMGDPVLRRADGVWAYQFAVSVDDVAMEVAEVVRGGDLLSSTAVQIVLIERLGGTPPRYLHVPVLLGPDGERLAKRRGDETLRNLRLAGVPAERVVGLLAWTLGLQAEAAEMAIGTFLDRFDVQRIPRHPVRLDADAYAWLRGAAGPPEGAPHVVVDSVERAR